MATTDRITDKEMQAKPGAADIWLVDGGAGRGSGRLVGRITPAGERLWYFRYSVGGQQRRLTIGGYSRKEGTPGAFTLKAAREEAAKLSALYRKGAKDLHAHRDQAEQAKREAAAAEQCARDEAAAAAARRCTVRQLFEQWQRAELVPQVRADGTRTGRKDSGEFVRQAFERRLFPSLGDTPAEAITKADLLRIVDDAKATGKLRTAGMLLSDMRQMFAFAEEREIVPVNVLASVRRAKLVGSPAARERTLTDSEIRDLARLVPLANMGPRSAAAIWLVLATGVRIGEAMGARWEHVDTVARTWFLPVTKNGRDHTIHLSEFALQQVAKLAALREVGPDDKPTPWLFPNAAGTGPVCIKSFGKQLSDRQRPADRRMQHRSKHTESLVLAGGRWTAHDLRRTAATIMARLGVSGDVIDECLNHVIESRVRRTYIRDRRPADQARAFDALGARLVEITTGAQAPSNVLQLPQRAA